MAQVSMSGSYAKLQPPFALLTAILCFPKY